MFAVRGVGFEIAPDWQVLVGQDGNVVDVRFTPVPEPAGLGLAAASAGLAGWWRVTRRRRGRAGHRVTNDGPECLEPAA